MKFIKEHRGWRIYLASERTLKDHPYFVAVKNDKAPIEGIDLPDLEADINEAER